MLIVLLAILVCAIIARWFPDFWRETWKVLLIVAAGTVLVFVYVVSAAYFDSRERPRTLNRQTLDQIWDDTNYGCPADRPCE